MYLNNLLFRYNNFIMNLESEFLLIHLTEELHQIFLTHFYLNFRTDKVLIYSEGIREN
jgi:hypothetical protein